MVGLVVWGMSIIESPGLFGVALGCGVAAFVWLRSSLRLERTGKRIEALTGASKRGDAAATLARSAFRKELHTAILYAVLAWSLTFNSLSTDAAVDVAFALLVVPIAATLFYGRGFLKEHQDVEQRSLLERRAEEALKQEAVAPRAWAARLAPPELPEIEGFEVGQAYEAGTGIMAGDFYDIYPAHATRLVTVIGDVTGHGIEPSITAFQVKYLLRVFLRQHRDPARALEELNTVLSAERGPEELVSLCAVVFDTDAATLRFASAGHPPAWFWHDGEIRALKATGPLLNVNPTVGYTSREIELRSGDLLLMYTDGLAEARSGTQLFGHERIAHILRRDPGQAADTLCKAVLEAARDFSASPLRDDVAILAVRRT
jgi:serine phosphatase RsbU (regulator of sigma subunit)